jgi:hypothetical protein
LRRHESARPAEAKAKQPATSVETPGQGRIAGLVNSLAGQPVDRAGELAEAKQLLENGFYHSEEGLEAVAESLLELA